MLSHPMRGAIFETWVLAELVKHRFNANQSNNLHFWRDRTARPSFMVVTINKNTRLLNC